MVERGKPMFDTKVRFLVCSDVHYMDEPTPSRERFAKMIAMGYEIAEKEGGSLDAVCVCGDFTNTGSETQFAAFRDTVRAGLHAETTFIPVLGGHEYLHASPEFKYLHNPLKPEFQIAISGKPHAIERLKEYLDCEPDTHHVIHGFHFIGLSTTRTTSQWYDSFTTEKIEWLNDQLCEAAADTPRKPIFVFRHPHIQGTVYGENGWSCAELNNTLVGFPQVVDFSGHSHAPCSDPRTVHQRDFTCVGTGSLSYMMGNDYGVSDSGRHDWNCNAAQALLVDADDAGNVRIRVWDAVENEFRDDRFLEKVWDPNYFTYDDRRILTTKAPDFAENSEIIAKKSDKKLKIEFAQADGDTVKYAVSLRRADGSVAGRKVIYSRQILSHPPKMLSVEFEDNEDANYVEITPMGYYDLPGKPIAKKIRA